ncbi:IS3 family transposase [Streptomyces sp. NPDC007883]|uniref:IS3 family transposase n=1 Tax=Streptomyces sp. NPDC007883 TaxID=3155116 RepID=UPI0033C560A1
MPPAAVRARLTRRRTRLVRAGIQASTGSVGDSFDNALAENLWMVIKTECIRGRVFATRAEANLALFEYIDASTTPAVSRNGSATSARSSTRRSTTPTRQRPNK